MSKPIRIRDTLALLAVIGAAAVALAQVVAADLHVPAARILVAQCQGFEALATVGGTRLTCDPHAAMPARSAIAVDATLERPEA